MRFTCKTAREMVYLNHGREVDTMRKFLKQFKRHPASIGIFVILTIMSLVEMNPFPVIFGIVMCPLLYLIWELLFLRLELMKVFWDSVYRSTKRK